MLLKRLGAGMLVASALAIGCGGGSTPTKTLTSVTIGGPSTVPIGSTIALMATASFSDGSTQAVAGSSTWESGNNPVATVSAVGVVTGVSTGTVNITATFQSVKSPAMTVQVTSSVTGVTVTGAPSVAVGATTQLTATATFSDNSAQNVTNSSLWLSSSNALATVSSSGVVTGVAAGPVSFSAGFQGVTSPLFTLTVATAVKAAFTVTPTNASDGNPGQCPIVPQSPSGFNLLNCKFDASSSTPAGAIVSYQWEIPEGGTRFTGVTVDRVTIKCGDLPGVSTTSQKNVKLTITTNTGGSNTASTPVLFVKANPC